MTLTALALFLGSAFAYIFTPKSSTTTFGAFPVENLPGILVPMGFFVPLEFAATVDSQTLQRCFAVEAKPGRCDTCRGWFTPL